MPAIKTRCCHLQAIDINGLCNIIHVYERIKSINVGVTYHVDRFDVFDLISHIFTPKPFLILAQLRQSVLVCKKYDPLLFCFFFLFHKILKRYLLYKA